MLPKQCNTVAVKQRQASVFAALSDETRLSLVARLANGRPCSISELTKGATGTRQAISKHLHVLETAGIVRSKKKGRENLFEFSPPGPFKTSKSISISFLNNGTRPCRG